MIILIATSAVPASAQQIINLFSGTTQSISATPGNTTSATIDGYAASVHNTGLTGTLSMTIGGGSFTVSNTGLVGGGSYSATETFGSPVVSANQTYQLSLATPTALAVGALTTFDFQLKLGSTVLVDENQTQLLALFGSGTSGVITFTTPVTLPPGQNLFVSITGSGAITALGGNSVSFTTGVVNQVPEPSPLALGLMGLGMMFVAYTFVTQSRKKGSLI